MLSELLREILLEESISTNEISDAIEFHKIVNINYEAKESDIADGPREIEVYAYGLSKANNPVIRAYQPQGDTASSVPSWKFFRLDGITDWQTTQETFSEPAPNFNPNGDKLMSVVYKIAKFDGDDFSTNQEGQGPKMKDDVPQTDDSIKTNDAFRGQKQTTQTSGPKLKSNDVFKTDTEQRMERLRQQLQNPQKIDLTQFDKKNKQKEETNQEELNNLRQKIGDNGERMSMNDLTQKLSTNNDKEEEIFKTRTERGMEKLRQQLENPQKIDLSQFDKYNRRKIS